jgi:hypothetical protein
MQDDMGGTVRNIGGTSHFVGKTFAEKMKKMGNNFPETSNKGGGFPCQRNHPFAPL